MNEDTPASARDRIEKIGTELARASLALRRARDAEVDAEHAYEAQRRAWLLSIECPKVTRSGTTAAERDAWVDSKCDETYFKFRLATAAREAAKDHLAVCQTQAMLSMALLKSVDTSYSMASVGQ